MKTREETGDRKAKEKKAAQKEKQRDKELLIYLWMMKQNQELSPSL